MVNVKFEYSKQAEKFFKKHQDVKEKFKKAIYSLFTGRKIDIKKMQGTSEPIYRVRINDYRVVYKLVNGEIIVVSVVAVASRGQIYNDF